MLHQMTRPVRLCRHQHAPLHLRRRQIDVKHLADVPVAVLVDVAVGRKLVRTLKSDTLMAEAGDLNQSRLRRPSGSRGGAARHHPRRLHVLLMIVDWGLPRLVLMICQTRHPKWTGHRQCRPHHRDARSP